MITLVAGAASGLLMASVFVGTSAVMLFILAKDSPPGLRPILRKLRPGNLAISIVVIGYPAWTAIGVLLGIIYRVAYNEAPGPGLGSPNLVYTLGILVITVAMAAPFAYLLRHVVAGVITIALAFLGIYGWLLPFLANHS